MFCTMLSPILRLLSCEYTLQDTDEDPVSKQNLHQKRNSGIKLCVRYFKPVNLGRMKPIPGIMIVPVWLLLGTLYVYFLFILEGESDALRT